MEDFKNIQLYDFEAEKAVIGAMIVNPELFSLAKNLTKNDFYYSENKFIFSLLSEYSRSVKKDFLVLKKLVENSGAKNSAKAMSYVLDLMDSVPNVEENAVKSYIEIVKDKATRRNRRAVLEKALNEINDLSVDTTQIDDEICQMFFNNSNTEYSDLNDFSMAFDDFFDEFEKRKKLGKTLPGLPTGFSSLDVYTGGLENEKLYVIGGRPAMGKTALALNIASNIAMSGKNVAIFSLEMSKSQIVKRIISHISKIKANVLKYAKADDEVYRKMAEVLDLIQDKILINDESSLSGSAIKSKCLKWNTRHKRDDKKIDCIVIDYLQLMSGNKKTERENIGDNSKMCKILAKDLKCPVVLLSQLNRANESRDNKMPVLSDLRESGQIEQDADVVAFVHREEYYNPTTENEGLAQIKIAKNRDGQVGTFELEWDSSITSFSNRFRG